MEKGNMKALIFCSLLVQSVIGNAVVSVTHDTGTSYTCGLANTAITISCTITGLSKAVVWSKNGILQVTCSNLVDTCVHGPGYNESRYTFSSNVSQAKFDFHISAATFPTDEGIYACQHGGDNANFTIRVCSKCTVDPVMNAEVNPTGTVQEGEVVSVTCNQGYVINGNSLLTCQSDGKWDVSWPACKGTTATTSPPAPTTSTTASATTVTSTIPISKTTTSSTTTTMTTLPNATNPATTTATSPKVSTSTTGSTSIRTATQEISTSTTTRSSLTTTMAANSDKGLITMIIVVSVIGGILVIAIIFMLFLLGHWKNGFVQIGHKKHAHNSSHRYVGHRIHQMKRKHNTTTGRSEHSTSQPHHKSDYSFYRGV